MEENRGVRGLLGLLGHPLGHSFSVAYFREKFSDFPQRGLVYRNFDFEDFEECRRFFNEAINLLRQMNYSEFRSENFNKYQEQLNNLISNGK